MGSLGTAGDHRETIVTQVSFGGFDEQTTAKELANFLENEAGVVWRCRVKTSWTPAESYPDFELAGKISRLPRNPNATKVAAPHAFVHFATSAAAHRALNAAGRCELIHGKTPLRAFSTSELSFRLHRRRNVDPFKFSDAGFEIGTLVSPNEFLTAWKAPESGVDFVIDPFDNCCKVLFSKDTAFLTKGYRESIGIKCDFKLEFLLREIREIRVSTDRTPFVLIFHLNLGSAPAIYYRTADDDIHESVPFCLVDDDDPWIRTTDLTPSTAMGRCNSFRISLKTRWGPKLRKALDYMKERRISLFSPRNSISVRNEPGFGQHSSDHFFSIPFKDGISFATVFMVNALVHRGIFNQHNLSEEFFGLLRSQTDEVNDAALRHIFSYKKPIFDAYTRLKVVQNWLLKNPKLLRTLKLSDDNAAVRRLVITPTKAYCLPPEIELSNRVLRKYKDVADRFLRVTFMDEGMQPLNSNVLNFYVAPIVKDITGNSFLQKTTIYRRVKSIMNDGFYLCGRKYSFLAFSSNQLRDRSAWFFAEDKGTSVLSIMDWMGKFRLKNVAKFAARMGQCFSSTYATVVVPFDEVDWELEDVERNGYCFSDGIGKITPDLAMEVAKKLELSENPPSAYQIRYAGCKGVVAVWSRNGDGIRLSLRPSMNKFQSIHTTLEIVSWTRFQPGFLNRQIVTLLSALNVPDDVFTRMQETMVCKLDQMLVDPEVAFEILTTSCAEQGNIAAMMLSAGFNPQTEPHLRAMLSCIRLSQLKDLSAKARIFVQKGRWLMGCLDELPVLEQGQCFIQASIPCLENCFLKHGSRFSGSKETKQVIVGTVAIAKNPCLHPGDVRILQAVDVPGLHHLVDCLVFPQKGDRPHSNEASGSDLDGDLYFVTWDENLIPPNKRSWMPMDYTPAEPKLTGREAIHREVADFFVKNITNENLGVICNAHVVHADLSEYGAMDEKCLQLAELAAIAVDFPKTGKQAIMPQSLKPKVYPDFMDKDGFRTYKSEKILGRLYRKIKDASNEDNSSDLISTYEDLPYDMDLEIREAGDYIADAWNTKCSYDRQLNALLGQYRVDKEGEVVTGHICSLPKHNSRKQGEIKERLKNAYYALHKQFRRVFEDMGPDFHLLTDDEKNVMYESKASAWYQVTYHPQWVKRSTEIREPEGEPGESEGEPAPARLSFAWIATDYLVRIKVRRRGRGNVGGRKPIDSLAKFLSERM